MARLCWQNGLVHDSHGNNMIRKMVMNIVDSTGLIFSVVSYQKASYDNHQ